MAQRRKKDSSPDKQNFANMLADTIAEQHTTLIGRNWPEIKRILDSDGGEIKLAFATTITDREASPGEQADKDNSVKTVLSFSEKHSDRIENALPDPAQQNLPIE